VKFDIKTVGLVPNLLAGFLSGFVTTFVLRTFGPPSRSNAADAATQTGIDPVAAILAVGDQPRDAGSPATDRLQARYPSEPNPARLAMDHPQGSKL
jgi:hypothetical protein